MKSFKIGDRVKINTTRFSHHFICKQRLVESGVPEALASQLVDDLVVIIDGFETQFSPQDIRFLDKNNMNLPYVLPATWFILARPKITGHHLTDMFKLENLLDVCEKV